MFSPSFVNVSSPFTFLMSFKSDLSTITSSPAAFFKWSLTIVLVALPVLSAITYTVSSLPISFSETEITLSIASSNSLLSSLFTSVWVSSVETSSGFANVVYPYVDAPATTTVIAHAIVLIINFLLIKFDFLIANLLLIWN